MRKAILDEGRPLSRVAAVQALNSRGVRVAGSDQVVNAGTALWRAKDEFINLKSHGYWPRDVAYPPAGYHPEQKSRCRAQRWQESRRERLSYCC